MHYKCLIDVSSSDLVCCSHLIHDDFLIKFMNKQN